MKRLQRKMAPVVKTPAAQVSGKGLNNNDRLEGDYSEKPAAANLKIPGEIPTLIPVKAAKPLIQRKESGTSGMTVSSQTSSKIEGLKGGGGALPANTRSFMESRFGADFSGVRIHNDAAANELSKGLRAKAFTLGNDIFFREGDFRPDSAAGRQLLAHELTHTVQQGASSAMIRRALHDEDDDTHAGIVEAYRRHRGYDPNGEDGGPSAAEIKYGKVPVMPPLTPDQVDKKIEDFTLRAAGNSTVLTASYMTKAFAGRATNADLDTAFTRIKAEVATLDFDSQMALLEVSSRRIIPILEGQFVDDPSSSSLDLLSDPDRYRKFAWNKDDFPGGPSGPNEGRAIEMHSALSDIRPERRANSGSDAVVSKSQFEGSKSLQRYIISELRSVPDFDNAEDGTQPATQAKGHLLNRHAQEAYVRMRNAAQSDGVYLIIGASYRAPEQAKANAAAAANPNAVASFSSHSLGLAFDLNLSYTDRDNTRHTYTEITTNPMQNVVNMRESAAHKWMFIHGASYGFYPFQQEPWHWEYNPPGFPNDFMEEFKSASAPAAPASVKK